MAIVIPEWLRWAKLRPAVIEFVAIVAAVLVALAVDEWRKSRDRHSLELEYAARLRADLIRDTTRFGEFDRVYLDLKARTLLSFANAGTVPPALGDPAATVRAVTVSTFIALPEAQSAVFREMESTGKLGLLRDPELRTGFANHYAIHDLLSGTLERPDGDYRRLVGETLGGEALYRWRTSGTVPDSADLARGLQSLVRARGFHEAVRAELVYAASLQFYLREAHARAAILLKQLNAAYPD